MVKVAPQEATALQIAEKVCTQKFGQQATFDPTKEKYDISSPLELAYSFFNGEKWNVDAAGNVARA